jgi:hypothetical protein
MIFAGGSGTQADPWQISTAQQLDDLRLYTGSSHTGEYFILINDIDLTTFLSPGNPGYNSGHFWDPIPDFYGHLNGDGFCILNLKIDYYKTGLFQYLMGGATITNLNFNNAEIISSSSYYAAVLVGGIVLGSVSNIIISNSTVTGYGYVGLIAGSINEGSISDCVCSGNVSGVWATGGIVGNAYISSSSTGHITLENCSMEGTIQKVSGPAINGYFGGVVGEAVGSAPYYVYIRNCSNTANIAGNRRVGGICGGLKTYGEITDCHNEGTIVASEHYAGGIVGAVGVVYTLGGYVLINRCYNSASVTGKIYVGGLVGSFWTGYTLGVVSECFVDRDATVYCEEEGGGLIGSCYRYVRNCFTLCDVVHTDLSGGQNSGAAIGYLDSIGLVEKCYAIGKVVMADGSLSDVDGFINRTYGSTQFNYFDSEASEQSIGLGATAKSTSEMKVQTTFPDWDFLTTWGIDPAVNTGYPYLTALPHPEPGTDHTLTYTAGTGGSISGTTQQTVPDGDDGSPVTAVPDSNYLFDQWSDGSTDNPRTDLNVLADIDVTASFIPANHTLTYTAGTGGSISGTTPQTVAGGADGTAVTAVPDPGYRFDQWSDANTDNPRTDLNVTADITVEAEFIEVHTIDYSVNDTNMGRIVGDKHQVVDDGDNGTLITATPLPYYQFVQWDDGDLDPIRRELAVTGDIAAVATFEPLDALHVKKTASGDGSGVDWDNACTTLKEGIELALKYGISDLRVAKGIYLPWDTGALPSGVKFKHFKLYNGLNIIGGYRAASTYDTTRDIDTYPSIMSGAFTNYNVYHVLYFDESYALDKTAVLDGFHVKDGKATGLQGVPKHSYGGGLLSEPGNVPVLIDCRIHDNEANSGGGVAGLLAESICPPELDEDRTPVIETSMPRLYRTKVYDNKANYSGGGVFFKGLTFVVTPFSKTEVYSNEAKNGAGIASVACGGRFVYGPSAISASGPALYLHDNKSTRSGGGAYFLDSLPDIEINSVLALSNISKRFGGGLMISGGSFDMSEVIMINNGARIGGGAFFESCSYTCTHTVFLNNRAATLGGGLYTIPYEGIIDRSTFENNSVSGLRDKKRGGAIYALNGSLNLMNTFFYGNSSDYLGGAIFTRNNVIHCAGVTALNNSADDGKFFYGEKSRLELNSSILRTNDTDVTGQISGDKYRCEIEDICRDVGTAYENITGVDITDDPLVETSEVSLPWNTDYHVTLMQLNSGSPCIAQTALSNFSIYSYYTGSELAFDEDIRDNNRSSTTAIGANEYT